MTDKKKKIILIDDDEMLCKELFLMLSDEGYNVSAFNDAEAGLKSLLKSHYDLLLLDLKMPKIGGLEILRVIRSQKLPLKVIIITGNPVARLSDDNIPGTTDEDDLRSADCIISKPFDPEALLSKIAEIF